MGFTVVKEPPGQAAIDPTRGLMGLARVGMEARGWTGLRVNGMEARASGELWCRGPAWAGPRGVDDAVPAPGRSC